MARKSTGRTRLQTIQVNVSAPAIISPEPEAGGYSAEVPALPGCYTQGETMQEVKANLREAIEGWLAVAHDEAVDSVGPKRKRA
jgi:predicted RNase H-like HicB family nuclease